ncbi:MAG: hypothetical protein HZA50_07975 [Planctomycetes bacterium]|nr:hypothetical protein [Planctomycetota bacterium]
MEWTAEIMTDPARDHELHVELRQDELYRARIYQDEQGKIQLQLYDGKPGILPVEWLTGIIDGFKNDLRTSGQSRINKNGANP